MNTVKKVRLKDIAYDLNLSVTCVSRSLRDCDDISEDTKKMVREKALELGYKPKYTEVKSQEKYVVALIIDKVKNPYFIKLCDILFAKLNNEKYDFLIMFTKSFELVDEELIKKCVYRNSDIVISFNEFDEKAIEFSKLNNIPLILIGRIPKFDYVNAVYTDDFLGGGLAFDYLFKNNKKNLIYIEEDKSEASLRRLVGFKRKLEKTSDINLKVISFDNLAEVYQLIDKDSVDGIFCYNDEFAYQIFKKYADRIDVFKKLYLVGYDNDIPELAKYCPNFKSIGFDYDELANSVVKIVKKRSLTKNYNEYLRVVLPVKLSD